MTTGSKEVWLSLALSSSIMALALLAAGQLVMVDLTALGERVAEFLGVEVGMVDMPLEPSVTETAEEARLIHGGGETFDGSFPAETRVPDIGHAPQLSGVALELPTAPPENTLAMPAATPEPLNVPQPLRLPEAGVRIDDTVRPNPAPTLPMTAFQPGSQETTPALSWNPALDAPPPAGRVVMPIETPTPVETPVPLIPPTPTTILDTVTNPEDRFPLLDGELDARLIVYRPPDETRPYFRLDLTARPDSSLVRFPQETLFLIDVSGSIPLTVLRQIRSAVPHAVAALPRGDRWNAAIFSESVMLFSPRFLPSEVFSERAGELERFIATIASQRRTNVYQAMEQALAQASGNHDGLGLRPIRVFFLSDGMATDQLADTRRIVSRIRRADRSRMTIHSVNVAARGDPHLLTLLAFRSRGEYLHEPNPARLADSLSALSRNTEDMLLANVYVSRAGMASVDDVYPRVLPNLYRRRPLSIWGRADEADSIVIRVVGETPSGMRELFFRAMAEEGGTAGPDVARDWAVGRAHDWLARLSDAPDPELADQLLELAEKYRLDEILRFFGRRDVRRAFYGR